MTRALTLTAWLSMRARQAGGRAMANTGPATSATGDGGASAHGRSATGTGGALRRLAVLPLLVLLTACGQPEPLRIGFLGGVSGRVADLGIGGRNGAQLAVERVNRAGGIGGRQVILMVKDDAQDPARAARAMREFAQSGVRLVIGPMTSAMAMAALPVAEEFGMLLVSPTVTTDLLSGKDDAFVRVVSPASQYAHRSAEYQLAKTRLRRLAAIHDTANLSYTESWLSAFRTRFEAGGGKVIVAAGFSAAPANALRELVARTLAENPDGLLLLANSVDAALIAQFARAERPDLPIVLSEWPATERFVELAGAAAEGVVATQFYDVGSSAPAYREFRETYRMRYGADPGFAAITGYDAAMLALTALAKSVDDPKPHLVGVRDFPGLQGLMGIDRYGDAQRRNYVIRVDGGRFVVLE